MGSALVQGRGRNSKEINAKAARTWIAPLLAVCRRSTVVIEPMPGWVSEAFPRQFSTCTAQEDVSEMFRRSYGYSPGQAVS